MTAETGKQSIMRREVSSASSLENVSLWRSCRELDLADCCRVGRLRVNDGQGSCRCANASDPAGAKRRATICSLRWQACSELQKESCCHMKPASLLVAFGNNSASGFSSHCAGANASFFGLSQETVGRQCGEDREAESCGGASLFFAPLANVSARIGRKHFHSDGSSRLWSFENRSCPSTASVHFTAPVSEGRDYVLRMEARRSLRPESGHPAPVLQLTIGNSSFEKPVQAQPMQRWHWLQQQFRAISRGMEIRIRLGPAACVDIGRVELAACPDRSLQSEKLSAVALSTEHTAEGSEDRPSSDSAQDTAESSEDQELEIKDLRKQVREDQVKMQELESQAQVAEAQEKEAEEASAAAKAESGKVSGWVFILLAAIVAMALASIPLIPKIKAELEKRKAAGKGQGSAEAEPKAAAKAKGKAKAKGGGKGQKVSPATLQAVLKIQAVIRGWKARLDVHPSGPKEKSRTLNDGEQLVFSIQNISLKNVPDVNMFGGVDPFVEVQTGFNKDPTSKGKTSASPEKSAKTEMLQSQNNPKFTTGLELTKVFNQSDQFINFLLFDSGTTEDTFIGSKGLAVSKLVAGVKSFTFDAPFKPLPQEVELKPAVAVEKGKDIKAKFDLFVFEALKFSFNIKQGEKLPEVDQFGGIDSFIEIRATRGDVRKEDFSLEPDKKCIWSGKTNVHPDTVTPKYNQELKAILPGDPSLQIQIILWDSNAPMADYPVGHHVMEVKEEISHKQNLDPLEHVIKFQKIPGQPAVPGYNKATLKFTLQTSLAEAGTPPPKPKAKAKAVK